MTYARGIPLHVRKKHGLKDFKEAIHIFFAFVLLADHGHFVFGTISYHALQTYI